MNRQHSSGISGAKGRDVRHAKESTRSICVGCSGWNYKSWRSRFYPADLTASKWLSFYAERFATVEINNSFYRLPEAETFAAWARTVPDGFVFAVKASRFLTHMKRLRDPEEPVERLFSRAAALGAHLGPVLYQLPGNFGFDLPRLEHFLSVLPPDVDQVMEFRNPSWYAPATYDCLERHGASLCLHDKAGSEIDAPFVGPIVYVRFHGTSGHYHGGYSTTALAGWADRLIVAAKAGRRVYAYFNNDPDAEATRNAKTLESELARRGAKSQRRLLQRAG